VRLSDYDFTLPPEAIAQVPVEPRDAARLFVHKRNAADRYHRHVRNLTELLQPGDLLVVNDTRVRPARLHARRPSGARVELLFLGPANASTDAGADPALWRALVRPAKKPEPGEVLVVDGGLEAELVEREWEGDQPGPVWSMRLRDPADPTAPTEDLLERAGTMPLPPYIERGMDDPRGGADRERYQTVYATNPGAVAAPTAGLHFTPELLASLDELGVRRTTVTLHVGAGTFRPVQVENPLEHPMHSEVYDLSADTVEAVRRTRAEGGRVIAVGTTSARVLESCVGEDGELHPGSGETRIFLHPENPPRVIDGLMTNFHLPKSTLLMLVAGLVGRETILDLYAEAIAEGYRFYSYGDAMLLLP
jgi:S-adenosylmethionine:tRNA ribosyltransferase-isomerase